MTITHDATTCHACAVIALRHASGGTLDPNATIDPARGIRSAFRPISDEQHAAFMARLNVLDLGSAIERAIDAAVPAAAPVSLLAVEDQDRAAEALRRAMLLEAVS